LTPRALEILEAINLYQNSQPMTFIVGLDRAVVDSLVAKHYQDKGLDRRKREQFLGRLDGVIHGAGLIEDRLIADKTVDLFDCVFNTKVSGALTLLSKLRRVSFRSQCSRVIRYVLDTLRKPQIP
jgi:NAD(P)-dependent dehydrogenase (short-subunit alcohol dehydrogenase family)